MFTVWIGFDAAEYLALRITRRQFPESTDFWDGNWLKCDLEISVGAFRGELDQKIRTNELERFREELEQLYQRLVGEAVFDTLEGWIHLKLVGDGRGHITLSGRVNDDPVCGNTLNFELNIDQTFLPAILRQLDDVCREYPVIGR